MHAANLMGILTLVLGLFLAAPSTAVSGTCEGNCGGVAADGCYCDEACHAQTPEEDCCADKCFYCPSSSCGGGGTTTTTTLPPAGSNNAVFDGQNVPLSLAVGQSFTVTLRFLNTGTSTWSASNNYSLGSESPRDGRTWGTGRLQVTTPVAPGQLYTFSVTLQAPSTTGPHSFQWRMVQDGVEWFGGASPQTIINVSSTSPPPPQGNVPDQYICPWPFPDYCIGMCGDGCQGIWNPIQGHPLKGKRVQKYTCECLKHDLSFRWCSKPGPGAPGCKAFLHDPAIAACNVSDPNGACDAERSFALKPDLGRGGLGVCNLTGFPTPAEYLNKFCFPTRKELYQPLRPETQPKSNERWLGGQTIIAQLGFRQDGPTKLFYNATTDGALMTFATPGRARLGISGIATGFFIIRVGPDSQLCTDSHLQPGSGYIDQDGNDLSGTNVCNAMDEPTREAVDHIYFFHNQDRGSNYEVPFRHIRGGGSFPFGGSDPWCGNNGFLKEGFKYCDVPYIHPGTYVVAAQSTQKLGGLIRGHGTADTFWFERKDNSKACAGETCGGGCCLGSGCFALSCSSCQQSNACGDACEDLPQGTSCSTASGGSGGCDGFGTCIPGSILFNGCTPSCDGTTCGASDGCGGTCCSGSGCIVPSCGPCRQSTCGGGCVNDPSGTPCTTAGGQQAVCDGQGTCAGGSTTTTTAPATTTTRAPTTTTTTTLPGGGGSCAGRCGNYNPSLPCQCDGACDGAGDCCLDKCASCGGSQCSGATTTTTPPPPTTTTKPPTTTTTKPPTTTTKPPTTTTTTQPPANVCGNGVCAGAENGSNCGVDCCDANTACWFSYRDQGVFYCRNVNFTGYKWYADSEATKGQGSAPPTGRLSLEPFCDDSSELESSSYECPGAWAQCCSLPNGWQSGGCF